MYKLLPLMLAGILIMTSNVSAQMIATDQQYLNQKKVSQYGSGLVDTGIVINTNPTGKNITRDSQASVLNEDAYMTIPLSSEWLNINNISYKINEGWTYTEDEKKIHGLSNHKSIDYTIAYGTPVYSPVDGFIQGSYYNTTLGATGDRVMYKNRTINYGLGYRIQIVYPDPKQPLDPSKVHFIQLAHLSRFSPKVAKTTNGSAYIYDPTEDAVKVDNYSIDHVELAFILRGKNTRVIPVKQGELIGYVGNSGLEHGENVDINYVPKSYTLDPHNSWDDAHIHVQTFARDEQGGKISSSVQDLYNLGTGATGPQYPSHDNGGYLTGGHLFKSMDGLLPDFAK